MENYNVTIGDLNKDSEVLSASAVSALIDLSSDIATISSYIPDGTDNNGNKLVNNEDLSANLSAYVKIDVIKNALSNADINKNTSLSDMTLGNVISAIYNLKESIFN